MDELRRSIRGQVLLPGNDGYDRSRTIWNAMVDKRPAVIVRPVDSADVAIAVVFGREHDLEIGVRCGGHSVVGLSVPDGGLMIDLSSMSAVRVDPEGRRAYVAGGALLGDLDRAAQAHGLATTAGNVSHTGVGGLTLGGGMGWLARQFGMACDNVMSAEVVMADGSVLRASAQQEPDLYWAIRGGGGNFGIVTEFEFALHPVAGTVLTVDFFYEPDDAASVLRVWREQAAAAPRQATFGAWVGNAPDWPFLDRRYHGTLLANAGFVWVGDIEEGRRLIEPLREVAPPLAEAVEETTYVGIQSAFDESNRAGMRRYWKGHYLGELSDEAIDAFLSRGDAGDGAIPANGGFQTYGGAIAELPDESTAFSHRDTLFEFTTSLGWTDPAEDAARIAGARRFGAALEPFSKGVYVNALNDEGDRGVRAAYSDQKLQKLAAIKGRYDPDNVFHLNHNIPPGTAGA
jgi:FAD/FMN-containing dehydrogenase